MTLPPPSELFAGFYQALQASGAVANMKAVADARPLGLPEAIRSAYRQEAPTSGSELQAFLGRWFELPPTAEDYVSADRPSLTEHVDRLWGHLARTPGETDPQSSLIGLANAYLIPGGMFRECYYWDSYFTIIGLDETRSELRQACVDALAEQIDRFGHVPNGNRTYYLSRSQPPTFYASVAALSPGQPEQAWARYLPQMLREHAYWMAGQAEAELGAPQRSVVRLPDGGVLNRYWDERATPRDEAAAGRDGRIAAGSGRDPATVYRDIRAGCASGWDFSSRWFADRRTMATIETTEIVPVDLNAFLFGLERAIADGAQMTGDMRVADRFSRLAEVRKSTMSQWLWNENLGVFDDLTFRSLKLRGTLSAAALTPMFSMCASSEQANRTVAAVWTSLLARGGVLATDTVTGEQWDAPNGWAPSQWIAVQGLENYGCPKLAEDVARRWLETVARVYGETGRLMEKYDVIEERPGGGGEYPLQDGFGWTNGVTSALLRRYPGLESYGRTRPAAR